MTRVDKTKYQAELRRVAKNLGLSTQGNIEASIIKHCKDRLASWVAIHGQPKSLSELLGVFGASLDMEFVDIRDDIDLDTLLKNIPPTKEPYMARLHAELDEKTDAVTVFRSKCESWERRFLAVVNCRDWHIRRVYFTKWHEIVHRILEGQQLRFAFRKKYAYSIEPEEVLVDRVAGELAFFSDIFQPVVEQELNVSGKLTFTGVERILQEIAPEASLQSTVIACLRYCRYPCWFIICDKHYKRNIELAIENKQGYMFPLPDADLRVRNSGCSPSASDIGIRIYQNMRVPESSVVSKAFNNGFVLTSNGYDRLEDWETSSTGSIGYGLIEVEAFKRDEEVWALLSMR